MAFTLVGGNNGIVVDNAYGIELYIKGGTGYYRLTCLYKPKSSDYNTSRKYSIEEVDTINLFEFTLTPKASADGAAFYPSELSYDELFTNDPDTEFTGSEIYIKKGSPLHYYLETNGYDEYVNINTPYLYFGKLYPKSSEDNTIQIETYFMKDYALNALPETNRTENLREFFGVAFDQLYSQVYNKMRNILRLSDPDETKAEYLHYLLESYGTTSIIPSSSSDYAAERFFVKNLSALLKRKGTYEALIVLFRLITHTTNRLNIYEQWHEPLPLAAPFSWAWYWYCIVYGIPYRALTIEEYCNGFNFGWEEHQYINYYANAPSGSGIMARYYDDTYPTWTTTPTSAAPSGSLLLSPHYRIELDLSTQPTSEGNIIKEELYNVLLEKFEEFRPVARFHTFSQVVGLLSDFTGRSLDTYDGAYAENIRTKCMRPVYSPIGGNYIFTNWSLTSTEIKIKHNLGTNDILVQLYSVDDFKKIYPMSIIIDSDDSIEIRLATPMQFYVFISSVYRQYDESNEIDIPEDLDTGSPDPNAIFDIWKQDEAGNRYMIFPEYHEFFAGSPHEVKLYSSEVGMTYYEVSLHGERELLYSFTATGSPDTFTVTHNLGTQGIMVEVFRLLGDGDNPIFSKIMPKEIELTNINYITIKVDELLDDSSNYRVVIRKVTNWQFLDNIGDVLHFVSSLKLGHGTSTSIYNPMSVSASGVLQDEITASYYTVKMPLTDYKYYPDTNYDTYNIKVMIDINTNITITEIGLFNTNNELVYYTTCSPIFAAAGTKLIFYYTLEGDTL